MQHVFGTKESKYSSEIRRSARSMYVINSLVFRLRVLKFILVWDEFQLVEMDLLRERMSFLPGHLACCFNFPQLK